MLFQRIVVGMPHRPFHVITMLKKRRRFGCRHGGVCLSCYRLGFFMPAT